MTGKDTLAQPRFKHYLQEMTAQTQILIVEDEELFASRIAMQVELMGYAVIGQAEDSAAALAVIEEKTVDLIIMDINLQGKYDGIELAEMIGFAHNIPIIFITSNQDDLTFRRATRSSPSAFLIKPFSDVQLKRTIELTLQQHDGTKQEVGHVEDQLSDDKVLFIRKRNKIHKVPKSEIYYLEADGKYTRVCTKSDFYLVRKPMKEIFALLPTQHFIQCHRSYVVNMQKVKSVDLDDDLIILEERTVPVSKREKDKLLERLKWI